ncbi:MAG TPA: ATP-binding protein [Kofleriaceae bacterium]|nr:ATP-binding protein [Kofleriaceae bacterium]
MVARKRSKPASAGKPRARRPRGDGELARLRARLREAEDTLEAIRSGHVDALVIQGPAGEQVFTLRGADHRYRQLVETMTEGALLVDRDATIVYGNARFAQLAGVALEHLLASPLSTYVAPDWHATLEALLAGHAADRAAAEVELVTAAGARIPVHLSATASWDSDGLTCVIATDLSAQQRDQELVAAERLTSMIVEQSAESVVVCDLAGRVVRASVAAHRAAGHNPLLQPFDAAFRIRDLAGDDASRAILAATRAGETVHRRELVLAPASHILLSAAPIQSRDGEPLGAVISFVDITDRKQLAAERQVLLEAAQAARLEAEAANRAKDEFLAMLGHELRNPLAPILTALEVMRSHATPPPRVREIIERQVKHVVTLVDDLLDVSRITQGKIELDRRPIELARIVTRAVELAGPLTQERGHTLEVDVPAHGLALLADETRIAQVLSNLLVNAAKYTDRGGRIAIRAARDGGDIVIRVRDNGMGIPPDILPHLFERFVQGRRTLDRAEGGLGLGLAIVSSMVALHGGTVHAASDGVGQGSEFTVRLPALGTGDGDGALEHDAHPDDPDAGRARAPAARRVLIVDDNVDAAELLAEALAQLGHTTRVAYDGPSALAIAAELEPEVAVLDIGLPGMSGLELAGHLRVRDRGAPRLIALTGYGQDADRRRSTDAGFDAHLIKPVDLGALARVIAGLTA